MKISRIALTALAIALAFAACKDKVTDPPPPAGLDLSVYFVVPDTGFDKFYNDGTNQTWLKDTTISGHVVADLKYADGRHVYFRKSDRAWVATLDTSGVFFELEPPLIAPPPAMPFMTEITTASSWKASPTNIPVSMMSQLVDTGLILTVPAATYDSVILIRQIFRQFYTNLAGQPETTIDSNYRWFAPGIDEIRRVQWDTLGDSVIREFSGGSTGT